MIIVEKNEGAKVPYTMKSNKLTVNDGELTLDLSRYERDFAVHLDICRDAWGMLVMGQGREYIAQIDIPAKGYAYEDDGVDENDAPKKKKVVLPFDANNVTLTLWAVGGGF